MNSRSSIARTSLLILAGGVLASCELPTEQSEFEERLVVFGHLTAHEPVTDTVFVSLAAPIDMPHEAGDRWVSDALVSLSDGETSFRLWPVEGHPGRYLDIATPPHIIEPGREYTLTVEWQDHMVTATTRVPETLSIASPTTSDWVCGGQPVVIPGLDLVPFNGSPGNLQRTLATGGFAEFPMDTVVYLEGPCYTSSFVSVPLFVVEWQAEPAAGLIRTVTIALEDTASNAIIDSSFAANAFKGPLLKDDEGNYYRAGTFAWNSASEIIPFSWLYFNYYGPHLVTVEITDASIEEYFEGDPLRQNAYRLPNSNVEGGYGLFYSSYAASFLVYVAPDPETVQP
ncbi:MAG: DUF4249 family protein [Fidelibacterota bacterium]|nr:MAG: DUF4249 family protein [Candidatus Neomarinimicrobiota bacterium]